MEATQVCIIRKQVKSRCPLNAAPPGQNEVGVSVWDWKDGGDVSKWKSNYVK